MTMLLGVLITCALLAAWGIAFTRHALRHDVPGFGFLDRLPDPAALLSSTLDKLTVPLRYVRRPAGEHAKLRVDLDARTGTLPRLPVDGAPPWTTAPQPELDGEVTR